MQEKKNFREVGHVAPISFELQRLRTFHALSLLALTHPALPHQRGVSQCFTSLTRRVSVRLLHFEHNIEHGKSTEFKVSAASRATHGAQRLSHW
jgi:hypothetical protein